MTKVKKNELYELGKIIATVLVVFAHAAAMYTEDGAYRAIVSSPFVAGVHKLIYAFHMPFFMFLSGCIYGYCIEHGKYRDTFQYIRGKAQKLLIPYIFFGAAYVAPAMVLLGLTDQTYWEYLVDGIFMALNARHLWYILALFWIYLLMIPVSKIRLDGIAKWVTILAISGVLFVYSRILHYRLDYRHFQISNALFYQLFFFFGMIFNELYAYFERIPNGLKMCLFAASILLLLTELLPGANVILGLLSKFAGILLMVTLLWFILGGVRRERTVVYKIIRKNAFGIYLFHPIIIYVLYSRLYALEIMPVVLVTAVTVVSGALSVLATIAMRKLRLNVLIGE